MNNLQTLILFGKATQWLHKTTNTHHVFQDQFLRGGPWSISEAKMKGILL